MRFLKLDLIRYGHFSGQQISFKADAALHIIYGPNEAGKSSTLSAFSDLLFGFPDRDVGFDFLYEAKDLRIGAEIENRTGESMSFLRRKGRKNTLLDGTSERETPLNDDALSPFIGNLSRLVFERAFGLNSERLRSGADEMLADGGEIGQMLFSAASGLTGLKTTGDRLAAEADQIYAPRKSINRSFYQVLDRHDDARKAERALELNATDWKNQLKEEREIEDDLSALRESQRKRRSQIASLERLQRLRGLLAEMDRYEAELENFADLGSVADDIGITLAELAEKRQALTKERSQKQEWLASRQQDIEVLNVDERLLSRRADISRLRMETGLYTQAKEGLPEHRKKRSETDVALAELMQKLAISTVDDLEKSIPDTMLRKSLSEEIESGRVLNHDNIAARKILDENRETLSALEKNGEGDELIDPTPLRRQFEALRPDLAKIADAELIAVDVGEKQRGLEDEAGSLRPSVADIFSLTTAKLPLADELKHHREAIALAQRDLQEAQNGLASACQERDTLAVTLGADHYGGPVLTRADIEAARKQRDQFWDGILTSLDAAPDARPAHWDKPYLNAIERADDLADRALVNAEEVARYEDSLARFEKAKSDCAKFEGLRDVKSGAVERALAAYRTVFETSGIIPGEPEQMVEWRRQIDSLLQRRNEVLAMKDTLQGLVALKAALHEGLTQIAERAGAAAEKTMSVSALAQLVDAQLQRISDRWDGAREREGALQAARRSVERSLSEVNAIGQRRQDFVDRFSRLLDRLGMASETTPGAAQMALELWAEVPPMLRQRRQIDDDLARDHERITRFETEATELIRDIAEDVSGEPFASALHKLETRVSDHAELLASRKTMQEEADRLKREIGAHNVAMAAVDTERSGIEMALPDAVSVEGLSARLLERSKLRHELREARRRFLESSDGAEEGAVRQMASEIDSIACRQEIETLTADEEADALSLEALAERRARCRQRRKDFEIGQSAEQAAFQRVSAETEARSLARDWVVLKLAENLLGGALERYRKGRADPILTAASKHFSTLTRDAFDGLTQNYGSEDQLVLAARRSGGQEVAVDGLSDGTRDQLYLALRLAFLEDYAQRNEPAPLIVDDIFQTFDDERSAAGLRALAGIHGVQTILFTHEKSLVDIAQSQLKGSADIIHL